MQARFALTRSRKLPPGSIGPFCMSGVRSDDRFYLELLRAHGPIFKLFWSSGHLKICLVGYPQARRLLARNRDALYAETKVAPLVPKGFLRGMSAEDHPHYRRLLQGALRDDLITAWEPELRRIIRGELSGLAEASTSDASPAERLYRSLDLMSKKLLFLVVFGVRPAAEIAPELDAAYQRLGPNGFVEAIGSEQKFAFAKIHSLVLQILESLRSEGTAAFGDGVLKRLIQAGPESILDETVIGNVIYMVERGRHDLRDLLRWIVKYLGDHPSVTAELRARQPEPGTSPSLAKACVLETLRLDQAEAVHRRAAEAFTFEGYHIPKGSEISILLRETHRDPDTFPEPDAFRPHRFLERTYSADQYAPFGVGEHQCIASSLVVGVSTMFVEELVHEFTWSIIGDGPRHRGPLHWQPSRSFAIDIRRNG
jgi:cytochrome P450